MNEITPESSSHHVTSGSASLNRSVLRAMSLLNAAGRHAEGATAATLADEVGLPRPTAFRLLLTLEETGMLVANQGLYTLGWSMYRLGRIADPHRGLRPRVQVTLDRLAAELEENVTYFVVTGPTSYDFTADAHGPHIMSLTQAFMSSTIPLHATAVGKILLAHLDNSDLDELLREPLQQFTERTIIDSEILRADIELTRERGYSIMDDELEIGMFGVGVAVSNEHSEAIGVLVASGRTERMRAKGTERFVSALQAAADRLSARLTAETGDQRGS